MVGDKYIVFVKKLTGENVVLKLLPETDENINSIKTAIKNDKGTSNNK